MADVPPSLKPIAKYVQKANEVQRVEPLVAYYCRCYAVEEGLKVRDKADPRTTKYLGALLDQMERDKAQLGTQIRDDGPQYMRQFAVNLFQKADDIDRAAMADKTTAKMFLAAALFFDVCRQFGELTPEQQQQRKYAAWKATEIAAALKRGERPQAGPPAAPGSAEAELNALMAQDAASAAADAGAHTAAPSAAAPATASAAAPAPAAPSRSYAAPVVVASAAARPAPSLDTLLAAEKTLREAISALQFQDADTAVALMRRAIVRLGYEP